jgi:V/A-type H+-transporting ATPase subunit I
MSIVPLVRLAVFGLSAEKEQVLVDLQHLGCLHIIPRKVSPESGGAAAVSPDARRALKFLLSSPHRRKQVRTPQGFDAAKVEMRAMEIEKRLLSLGDERDHVQDRIKHLQPWGDFSMPPLEELRNLRLWFYLVPHHLMNRVEASALNWAAVHKDERFDYVVVISEEEPEGMPVARTMTGNRPLSELERRLVDLENEIEDLEAERFSLTRWCDLYTSSLNELEDHEELRRAHCHILDNGPLFALEGWAPREMLGKLRDYSDKHHVALDIREPSPGETPPTLLVNPPALGGGQDLLTFYMTPNYWLSDPSIIIFFSFVLFFALILADAGYAVLLGAGLLLIWRGMGTSDSGRRLRVLFAAIVAASVIFGVMVGSYFGKEPAHGTLLASLKVLDLNNYSTMMAISIVIGALHISIANVMVIIRKGWNAASLAPLGWIVMIAGALVMAGGGLATGFGKAGIWMLAGGAAAVLLFTGVGHPPVTRFLHGLERLAHLSNAFGDVMSYLRLFALGLASASLAMAFNDLARQVSEAVVPGLGLFLSFMVLFVGHGLNLVLGIMAGVVHGLRLNVIEFLNWSTPEEGYPFRAFAKKEVH